MNTEPEAKTLTDLAVLDDLEHDITRFTAEDNSHWGAISKSPRKIKAILALLEAGKTQTEVAQLFKITQPTVSRLAHEWMPVTDLAERRSKALSLQAVESLAKAFPAAEKAGKHGPQMTLLQAAGVLKDDSSKGVTVVVQQGVSLPGVG